MGGALADEFSGYQGSWRLGIRVDRLHGVVPADRLQPPDEIGNAYSRKDYTKHTTAVTEELVNAPEAVTERLVAQLLRGLGIDKRYLPVKP